MIMARGYEAMDKQTEYADFVRKYFNDVGVTLPDDMNIWITPDADKDDRYEAVLAVKDDKDEWTEAGFMKGADCYFIGNYRIGYLLPQAALLFYTGGAGLPTNIRDNFQYILPVKSWCIKHALFITYFRVVKPWGTGAGAPVLKVDHKIQGGST